jgi:hypothetical protein
MSSKVQQLLCLLCVDKFTIESWTKVPSGMRSLKSAKDPTTHDQLLMVAGSRNWSHFKNLLTSIGNWIPSLTQQNLHCFCIWLRSTCKWYTPASEKDMHTYQLSGCDALQWLHTLYENHKCYDYGLICIGQLCTFRFGKYDIFEAHKYVKQIKLSC